MGNYTRFGVGIFDWKPLRDRSPMARWTWVTLYMSAPAKRLVPGLWHGGVSTIADAGHLSAQDATEGVEELVTAGLVQEHKLTRVLRLTMLPDDAERPANGKVILSWWARFQSVPASPVRDQHVHLLYQLLTSQEPTSHHLDAWNRSFGTMQIPSFEPSSITLSVGQQSLFPEKPKRKGDPCDTNGIGYGMRNGIGYRFNSNDFAAPETVSDTVMYKVSGYTSGSGSGSGSERAGGVPVAMTPVDVVAAIAAGSGGRFAPTLDARLAPELDVVARNLAQDGVTLADLAVVGEWLGAGGMDWKHDLGARWASGPGNLGEAVHHARAWNAQGRPDPSGRRVAKSNPRAGASAPAPASSFGSGGRRKLT